MTDRSNELCRSTSSGPGHPESSDSAQTGARTTAADSPRSPRCPARRRCRPSTGRTSPLRRRSSYISVISSRVPVAPSGCPSAMAPPLTLTLLRSRPSSFSTARYLRRERFVHLDQVDVVQLQPGFLQRDARRRNRARAHDLGIDARDAPAHDASHRLQITFLELRRAT